MEKKLKVYETLTWVFGFVIIVLAILLWRQNGVTTVDNSGDKLKACGADIAAWRVKYPAGSTPTVSSQEDLVSVLQNCVNK